MLWSEIGSIPQIERSGMDGSQRKVVVSRDLSWPVGLAYDFMDDRMYWADEKLRCIGSASLDGDNIKVNKILNRKSQRKWVTKVCFRMHDGLKVIFSKNVLHFTRQSSIYLTVKSAFVSPDPPVGWNSKPFLSGSFQRSCFLVRHEEQNRSLGRKANWQKSESSFEETWAAIWTESEFLPLYFNFFP